jgi:2-methylisocitrate lyase-like PEP mutase family enzyme
MDTKTQQQYAETFRGLHKKGDPLVLFNAWDAATAKAIAKAFPAVATSSGGSHPRLDTRTEKMSRSTW